MKASTSAVRRSRRGVVLVIVLAAITLLAVAVLSWLGLRLSQAQDHLDKARAQVPVLQRHLLIGNDDAVAVDVQVIQRETRKARAATNNPVVRAAGAVPYLGRTADALRGLARVSTHLSEGPLVELVEADLAMSPQRLRASGATIDVAGLTSARPPLLEAATGLNADLVALSRVPGGSFVLDPVDNARASMFRNVSQLRSNVLVAARFAKVAPAMFGADGTRRYFVALVNPNEARGSGGVIGGYLVMEARGGTLRIVQSGPARKLPNLRSWVDANRSADFPTAAAKWASLWQRTATDRAVAHVDGVLSLDPLALAELLATVGGVPAPGGVPVTADNVVTLLTQGYAAPANVPLRPRLLATVAEEVIGAVLTGRGDSRTLASRLGRMSGSGHLRLWSSREEEEAVLRQVPIAGAVPEVERPYAGLVVDNLGGNKLDAYLNRSLTYLAETCGASTRKSTIVVRLSNEAPFGLPTFLTTRKDNPPKGTRPLQSKYAVAVYATPGAKLSTATLNGQPVSIQTTSDHGHPVYRLEMTLDRRAPRSLELQLVEPTVAGPPDIPEQPLVVPQQNLADVPICRRGS